MLKKIIVLYTGEPRALSKGLKFRDEILDLYKNDNFVIESRYLLCYLSNNKVSNKNKILNTITYFKKDKYLKSVSIEARTADNLYVHFMQQKFDILERISKNNYNDDTIFILTRTDWRFTDECKYLINCSIKNNYISSPGIPFEKKEYNGTKYYSFNDHFLVFPAIYLEKILKAFSFAIQLGKEQKNLIFATTNKFHSGNGKNRYGSGPENYQGYGFAKAKLTSLHKNIPFNFYYGTGSLNATRHNIIRQDASSWMGLTKEERISKFLIFLKNKLVKFIKSTKGRFL